MTTPTGETIKNVDPINYMRAAWADYLTDAHRHAVASVAVRIVDADAEFRGQAMTERERAFATAAAAVALHYQREEQRA